MSETLKVQQIPACEWVGAPSSKPLRLLSTGEPNTRLANIYKYIFLILYYTNYSSANLCRSSEYSFVYCVNSFPSVRLCWQFSHFSQHLDRITYFVYYVICNGSMLYICVCAFGRPSRLCWLMFCAFSVSPRCWGKLNLPIKFSNWFYFVWKDDRHRQWARTHYAIAWCILCVVKRICAHLHVRFEFADPACSLHSTFGGWRVVFFRGEKLPFHDESTLLVYILISRAFYMQFGALHSRRLCKTSTPPAQYIVLVQRSMYIWMYMYLCSFTTQKHDNQQRV